MKTVDGGSLLALARSMGEIHPKFRVSFAHLDRFLEGEPLIGKGC